MTPEKQRQKLVGQTTYAQKVFQFVPISEAWPVYAIASEMQRVTGSRPDGRTLAGCLLRMADAGLVRASSHDAFQRTPVSMPSLKTQELIEMPEPKELRAAPVAVSAIDILGGLASKLRGLAQELETAALLIEEGQAAATADLAKFKQFQALLKDIA